MSIFTNNSRDLNEIHYDSKQYAFEYLQEELEVYSSNLDLSMKCIDNLTLQQSIVMNISKNIQSRKIASESYFVTVGDYTDILKSIASNLGTKTPIPSLETFQSKHSTQQCHSIAIEGVVNILKAIWEKIKEFFFDLFKKIRLFFKRLAKLNLDLNEYEVYVEKMVSKLRSSKVIIDKPTVVKSKLATLLADVDSNRFNSRILLIDGVMKTSNFIHAYTSIVEKIRVYTTNIGPLLTEELHKLPSKLSNIEGKLKQYRGANKAIVDQYLKAEREEASLPNIDLDTLNEINEEIYESLDGLGNTIDFVYKALDKAFDLIEEDRGNYPDSIQSTISEIYDTVKVQKVRIKDRQVANFNAYFIYVFADKKDRFPSKFIVKTNIEHNTRAPLNLELLQNVDNIEKLYSLYVELKSIDLSKFDVSLNSLEDLLEKSIHKLRKCIEDMQKHMYELELIIDDLKKLGVDLTPVAEARRQTSLNIAKFENKVTGMLLGQLTMTKEISHGMASIYGELRIELIKYIYKSAEQYN